jgi:hypothetical protein
MSNTLLNLSTNQLRQALVIREKIEALERDLEALLAGTPNGNGNHALQTWTMSTAGRAKTGATQKARWAKEITANGAAGSLKPRRRLSPQARAKIAAVARARWAKVKAQGRNAL